jgi:hypothetical protein
MSHYNEIISLYKSGVKNKTEIARKIFGESADIERHRGTIRRAIRKYDLNSGVLDECESVGIDASKIKNYWYKGKHYSINVAGGNDVNLEEFKSELISEIKTWAPSYKKINRAIADDPHCLVFDPADIHIGKLSSSFETGEEYNQQIAVKRVLDGMHGIVNRTNGYNINQIIFIAGNDILHIDNPRRQTTSGTPQDTDGMWYDNFVTAKKLLIDIIETLMSLADVHVVFNPSNHDFMSGFMLLQCVEAWFSRCKNVTFDNDMKHRKYTVYGRNLIGSTHMDGAKIDNLPLLMAHEASSEWHECTHRYIYGHHIHHKSSKDIMSVNIETLRSPSSADGWHHRNGYQHSPKAVEGFIHHPLNGQVARLTHIF